MGQKGEPGAEGVGLPGDKGEGGVPGIPGEPGQSVKVCVTLEQLKIEYNSNYWVMLVVLELMMRIHFCLVLLMLL